MQTRPNFALSRLATCLLLATSAIAQPAIAEEISLPETDAPYTFIDAVKDGKSLTNFLLRYETVDQNGFQANGVDKLDSANGLFLRSLVGWQTVPYKNFSFTAQLTDVHQFTDNHNDRRGNVSESGNGNYANIVDPSFTDMNQLFVDWTGIKNTKVRLGRQVVNLDNVRFVGDIAFRLNTQVFDGISVLNKSLPNTEIFASHFAQIRQINTELRQSSIDLLNAKYRISPSESLVGYGYFLDVENLSQNGGNPLAPSTAAQGGNGLGGSQDINKTFTTDQSNKTIGVRLDGARAINPDWKGIYTAEFAKQSDYAGGNPEIDAHYYKLGGGASYAGWTVRVDREKLSSNDGKYGFQTPMGTNHLFQGWADHFLTTPRQGIEDTFLTVIGNIQKVNIYAAYHVFRSDEKFQSIGKLGDEYGTEFNARLAYPVNKNLVTKFEYAKFNEKDVYGSNTNAARKGDKQIIWLTAHYIF
jgi:hypothetical protein